MGKIGGGRLVAAGIADIEAAQAVDDQRAVCRFVNDGKKLEKSLFEGGEFMVLVEETGGFHQWFRSMRTRRRGASGLTGKGPERTNQYSIVSRP